MLAVIIISILAGLALFYLLVSVLIANGMAMTLRVPIEKTPASLGLAYEDVSFSSRGDNIKLAGWYLPAGSKSTIIVTHGGKRNRADATTQLLEMCGELAGQGFNILTFDRRGCGLSAASPRKSRAHFERDFGGAVDYIRSRSDTGEKVFLLGISIGAVAAIMFAYDEDGISGIVADSCFVSIPEMVKRVIRRANITFSIFSPTALWAGEKLFGLPRENAIDRVGRVSCPVLFINGAEDYSVPAEDTHRLHQASDNPQDETWIAPGADHSQAYLTSPAEYIGRVTGFFTGTLNHHPD
ncbi:alpha/beta hydrolase [Chloroflexota bacterium]